MTTLDGCRLNGEGKITNFLVFDYTLRAGAKTREYGAKLDVTVWTFAGRGGRRLLLSPKKRRGTGRRPDSLCGMKVVPSLRVKIDCFHFFNPDLTSIQRQVV